MNHQRASQSLGSGRCRASDLEVGPADHSAGAVAFYSAHGARPINTYWYVWEDIRTILAKNS